MKLTVISHFYNEEFLLPFWLRHHVPMFDHGIMIDYASTDASVEIIRNLAPNWEIRPSRNEVFHYIGIDQEVMDIERTIRGWKSVLNTTEFLVHPNLRGYLNSQQNEVIGVRATGLIMVDRPSDRNSQLTDDPLVKQKHYGYVEADVRATRRSRNRLIHRARDGMYRPGRHSTKVPSEICDDLFLSWFGWCPMDHVKNRKLQIKYKIPPEHFAMMKGIEHNVDEKQLEENYLCETKHIVDLWDRLPLYKSYIP